MKLFKKIAAVGLLTAILFTFSGCSYFFKVNKDDTAELFDRFCEEMFTDILAGDSFNAHYMVSDPSEYGVVFTDEDFNLGTISLEDSEEYYSYIREKYSEMKAMNYSALSDEQQLTYDILETYMEIQLGYEGTDELVNLFAPNSGIISNLSTNFIEYQFYDEEDVKQYLMFLADVDNYMEQVFDFTRKQAPKGYFMPEQVADKVIEMCQKYKEAENEPLIITFEDRINTLDLSSEKKQEYIERNAEYVEKYYLPVYEKTIDLLEELKKSGNNDGGLSGYGKTGIKYYEAIVAEKTSSDITPDELADYLDDAMDDVIYSMVEIYYSDEDTYNNAGMYQPDFDNPEAVMEFLLDNIEAKFPKPCTQNYSIEYQNPACETDGVLAYYVTSRIDDISRNNIKVNGSAVAGDTMTMYLTLAHEGFPGHLYQYTAAFDHENIPEIRKALDFIGVTEGWAEYASVQCLEYLDISDSMKEMIYLNEIFSYILCSRLDVGIHYEGWSVRDSYEYLSEYIECDEELAEDIYYDIAGDPGVYLPYTVGHLYMRELREKAEKKLGSKFDEKEYHQFIISLGPAPFDVIEKKLDDWLAQR
ncbi:MAG: DUF885 domain-containing protein [Butyrivibrio sp.]